MQRVAAQTLGQRGHKAPKILADMLARHRLGGHQHTIGGALKLPTKHRKGSR
jgi:hypothetical protein